MMVTILDARRNSLSERHVPKAHEFDGSMPSPVAVLAAYAEIAAGRVELIDARSSEEFRALHVPGAVNVQLSQLSNWARRAGRRRTSKPIYVYAMGADESRSAAETLAVAGLANVAYLESGIVGWHNAQLPCVAVIDGVLVRVVIERVGLPETVLVLAG